MCSKVSQNKKKQMNCLFMQGSALVSNMIRRQPRSCLPADWVITQPIEPAGSSSYSQVNSLINRLSWDLHPTHFPLHTPNYITKSLWRSLPRVLACKNRVQTSVMSRNKGVISTSLSQTPHFIKISLVSLTQLFLQLTFTSFCSTHTFAQDTLQCKLDPWWERQRQFYAPTGWGKARTFAEQTPSAAACSPSSIMNSIYGRRAHTLRRHTSPSGLACCCTVLHS